MSQKNIRVIWLSVPNIYYIHDIWGFFSDEMHALICNFLNIIQIVILFCKHSYNLFLCFIALFQCFVELCVSDGII